MTRGRRADNPLWIFRPPGSHAHDLSYRLGGSMIRGEQTMPMHTPSKWIFVLALALAILALIGALAHVPFLTAYAVWLAIVAYVVLAIGCLFKTT
jgi:hypothetical protein